MISRPIFGNKDIKVETLSPLLVNARLLEASPVHAYLRFFVRDDVQEIAAVENSISIATVTWKN
jgi:hypothetical protein